MATITEQVVREAPEIEAIKVALLKDAQQLAADPIDLADYQVAGLTDLQRVANLQGEQGIGAYQPYLTSAGDLLNQASAGPAQTAFTAASPYATSGITQGSQLLGQGAQGISGAQIAGYMNPYQQAITDEINRSYDLQANTSSGQAVGQGAYGGSRQEIALQEINRNRASAIAEAQATNFLNAQNMATAEQQRQLTAGQGIGSLGLQGGQTLSQMALAQGDSLSSLGIRQAALGETEQKLNQGDTTFSFDLGERQRMLDQMTLDATRRSQIEEAYEPYQRVGFLSDIYKGAPTTQMSLTGASTPTASAFQQLVGGLTAVGSTAAAANKAGLFG